MNLFAVAAFVAWLFIMATVAALLHRFFPNASAWVAIPITILSPIPVWFILRRIGRKQPPQSTGDQQTK